MNQHVLQPIVSRGHATLPSLPLADEAADFAACPWRSRGFCGNLDSNMLQHLTRRSSRVTLARGVQLHAHDLSILTTGILRAVHYGADGRREILGLTLPGDVILGDEAREQVVIEAATEVTLCRIHPASLGEAHTRCRSLRQSIYVQIRTNRDRTLALTGALRSLTPEQRVADFLTRCPTFMPWRPLASGGGVLSMLLERQDIAALLGTTAETVCRVLHRLDKQRLIVMRDARHFEIPDMARLASSVRADRADEVPDARLPAYVTAPSGRDDRRQCRAAESGLGSTYPESEGPTCDVPTRAMT